MLKSGELQLDRRSRRAYLKQEEINLTPKAMLLLEYFMTHPDELLTRERLLDVVWGWDYPVGSRAVDTRIAELQPVGTPQLREQALTRWSKFPAFIDRVKDLGFSLSIVECHIGDREVIRHALLKELIKEEGGNISLVA